MRGKGRNQTTIVFAPGQNRSGQKAYTSDAFFKFHGTPAHPISVSISDIAFSIVAHEGILWKDGELHAVKINHANRVDIHDVDSYMENAYITNFDLRVCSNVTITGNTITNYNIQARYPEDKDDLYNTLTPQACQEMIDETKQMTQWIKDALSAATRPSDSSDDTSRS